MLPIEVRLHHTHWRVGPAKERISTCVIRGIKYTTLLGLDTGLLELVELIPISIELPRSRIKDCLLFAAHDYNEIPIVNQGTRTWASRLGS